MPLALQLFADTDGLDLLIEESAPWLALWLFALTVALAWIVIAECIRRLRHRSPVDKLLRRRFG